MFNKRLLVSITLDKKKLRKSEKESCIIDCIPTVNLLTRTERNELIESLYTASRLLRTSYIRSKSDYK